MTPLRHWSELVPVRALDRFGELWRRARVLGKRPRVLLTAGERAELDQVEAELDDLTRQIRAAQPVAGMPRLVGDVVELVHDVRKVQRYYQRTVCPVARRELPALELATDARVGELVDVLEAVKGGAR